MRVMRAELRRRRLDRGWSLKDVAERLVALGHEEGEPCLGLDGITVGRWERGERQPRAPYPKLLCLLYEASASKLGIVGVAEDPACERLDDDVERRTLLRLLAGALAAPLAGAQQAGADRLATALAKPSGADEATASLVEAAIANARRLDDVLGCRAAVKPALAQRDVIHALLKGGPPPAVAKRLTEAAAELSQFLGWCAYDMNDHRTSRGYLDEALRLAHEADAESLGAYVLGHCGHVEMAEDRPQQALALAEAARSRAEVNGSAGVRSWLAAVEARALASLGDRTGAERALDRARTTLARSRAEDEPACMYFWDGAGLKAWVGSVYLDLGLAEPARRAMNEAHATSDTSNVRDRAIGLTRLGQTYVLDGEVEEACRLGGKALTIATSIRSDRAVLRIRTLRTQLGPWGSEAMVRELDEQIASTAAWFRPVSGA